MTDELLVILAREEGFPPPTAKALAGIAHAMGVRCPQPSEEEVAAALEDLVQAGAVEKLHSRGRSVYRLHPVPDGR